MSSEHLSQDAHVTRSRGNSGTPVLHQPIKTRHIQVIHQRQIPADMHNRAIIEKNEHIHRAHVIA